MWDCASTKRACEREFPTPGTALRTSTMFPSGYRVGSLSSSMTICLMNEENCRGGVLSRDR